jgi:hypothetical protein
MPVKITLKPLDTETANSVILGYCDKKGFKILYKYKGNKIYYWFTKSNNKYFAGIYNRDNQILKYKAL